MSSGGQSVCSSSIADRPLQTETLWLGSPFDYRRQAEIVLLDGMPDPSSDGPRYERAAIDMIRRYVARSDGRAFVLFTSYEMMKRRGRGLGPVAGRAEPGAATARPTACRGAGCCELFKEQSAVGAVRRG